MPESGRSDGILSETDGCTEDCTDVSARVRSGRCRSPARARLSTLVDDDYADILLFFPESTGCRISSSLLARSVFCTLLRLKLSIPSSSARMWAYLRDFLLFGDL